MTSFFTFAARTPVILASLIVSVAVGLAFTLVTSAMDGAPLLDMTSDAEIVRARLGSMSEEAKRAHFMGTLTLDIAYPLSLMTLLGGITYRFAPRAIAAPLALVSVVAALTDFAENASILLLLSGIDSLIEFKSLMTQIKFSLFTVAGVITLLCLLYGAGRRLFGRR